MAAASFDAVVSFDVALAEPFLGDALRLLRPGGRLITVDSAIDPDTQAVSTLEASGYVRILVETGAECPLPVGRLARGEKSHVNDDTRARVRVALMDNRLAPADLAAFRGRYVHLLIRQTPNLPVWKLERGQRIEWNAVALRHDDQPVLLAFSSLPAAVAFMQEAVLKGTIRDVNKVAKFKRPSAQDWNRPVLLDARADQFQSDQFLWLPVDPEEAELPDE
ncbi:MAG: hypothetical protein IPK19_36550 [Chloroflexi bacterium]|nr:hypothetical protein [Chloroflexota bacterium]